MYSLKKFQNFQSWRVCRVAFLKREVEVSMLELVCGDRRTNVVQRSEPWMKEVAKFRERLIDWGIAADVEDFDGLRYNETASVALLGAAAFSVGMVSLTEFVTQRRLLGRGRPYAPGRADLWVGSADADWSWAIEAKQMWLRGGTRQQTIMARYTEALNAARALDQNEADQRLACLILCQNDLTDEAVKQTQFNIREVLGSDGRVVWRVGGGNAAWIVLGVV